MNQTALHRKLASKELRDLQNAHPLSLFKKRLEANLPLIQNLFRTLYPEPEHDLYRKKLPGLLEKLFEKRPEELKLRDLQLLKAGDWHQSHRITGMQLYVDLFNGNLKGV